MPSPDPSSNRPAAPEDFAGAASWRASPGSRRRWLSDVANGFGMLGLAGLLAPSASQGASDGVSTPEAPVAPPVRAKRLIFLFMGGGPSHVDLLDPKPRLQRDHGKPLPFEKPKLARTTTENLMACPFGFRKRGESGIEVSDLLPRLGDMVDDLCVVRSLVADNINHSNACLQMHTGEQNFSRPSLGAWLLHGLGSETQNLPGFVAIGPGGQESSLWGASFLPAACQGTRIQDLARPIDNLASPRVSRANQRTRLDLTQKLNALHRADREGDSRLDARIESYELAFRMQVEAPEAFDIEAETDATRRDYGLDDPACQEFGKRCLLARRLVERGVRCVEVFSPVDWDHHTGIRSLLPQRCAAVDRPIAALLADLKARGLLDETLVLWGGEFGRSPVAQKGDGRDHHPYGFTMWLAGGGVKGGMVHGATDDFGWHATEDIVHVHDLHATILHLMGIDHERLTFRYSGREYRLTDVYGHVVRPLLA